LAVPLASQKKNLWNNSYVQAFVVVVLAAGVVLFFLFGSQLALNTNITPALAVVSGSMCIPYDGAYDGWSQPFARTLHVGDIIIIQGVSPDSLKTTYPNSDIIVFHQPNNPDELIVHRIVNNITIDGKLYFFTKGDGNSAPDTWPTVPTTGEYDPWQSSNSTIPDGAVSEDLIVGKVVMRIPWIGNAAIFMHDTFGVSNSQMFVPVILILISLLVIVEFGWSLLKKKP
jgi:signal peptidase I